MGKRKQCASELQEMCRSKLQKEEPLQISYKEDAQVTFPAETWLHITEYMTVPSLLRLRSVCTYFRLWIDSYVLQQEQWKSAPSLIFKQLYEKPESCVAVYQHWHSVFQCNLCTALYTHNVMHAKKTLKKQLRAGHLSVCDWLYNSLDMDAHVLDGFKMLRIAVRTGKVECYHWCVQHFQVRKIIDCERDNFMTDAIQCGHLDMCKLLHTTLFQSSESNNNDNGMHIIGFCRQLFTSHANSSTRLHELYRFSTPFFDTAVQYGHLPICKWLHAMGAARAHMTVHTFYIAALGGHLKLCQWHQRQKPLIASQLRTYSEKGMFHDVLKNVKELRLPLLRWLQDTFQFERCDLGRHGMMPLRRAVVQNSLECYQWLSTTFCLQPSTLLRTTSSGEIPILTAITYDHPSIVQWELETWSYSTKQVQDLLTTAILFSSIRVTKFLATAYPSLLGPMLRFTRHISLHSAAERGSVEMGEWLWQRVSYKAETYYAALYKAATAGHVPFCEWLHSVCLFTVKQIRAIQNQILVDCLREKKLDVCDWLCRTFSLTVSDLRSRQDAALKEAASHNHWGVCTWLHSRVHYTMDELYRMAACYYYCFGSEKLKELGSTMVS